jgi:hypothetical protein
VRAQRATSLKGFGQVDVHNEAPFVLGHAGGGGSRQLHDRLADGVTHAGDQGVQMAEPLQHLLRYPVHVSRLSSVAGESQGVPAQGPHLLGHAVDASGG